MQTGRPETRQLTTSQSLHRLPMTNRVGLQTGNKHHRPNYFGGSLDYQAPFLNVPDRGASRGLPL